MKRILKILFIVLSIILLSSIYVSAENNLNIDGVDLALGSDKDDVLSLIDTRFKVNKLKDDYVLLMNNDGPPYITKGILLFKDGILNTIDRNWGTYNSDNLSEFRDSFLGLLKNFTKDNGKPSIIIEETNAPGFKASSIKISLNNKKMIILFSDYQKQGLSVGIQEEISLSE